MKGIIVMKKLLSVIICACLVLSMFTFVACDVTDTEKEETSSSATENEQTSAETESNTNGETTTGTGESSSEESSSVTESNGTGNNEETTTAAQQGGNNQEVTTTAQQGGNNNQEVTTAAQQGGNNNQEVTTAAQQGDNNTETDDSGSNNPPQNVSNAYNVYMNAVNALNNASNYTATVLQTVNYTMAGGATQIGQTNVQVLIDGRNEISDVNEQGSHHVSHYVDGIYYTISLNGENPQGKMFAVDYDRYESSYSDKQSILLPTYPEKCFTADKVSIRKEVGGKYTLTLDISHDDYIEYMVGQGMPSANTPTFEKVQLIVTIGADGKVESHRTYMAYNYQGVYAVVDMTIAFSNYGSTVVEAPENLDLYVDPSTPPTGNGDNEENKEETKEQNKEENKEQNNEENKEQNKEENKEQNKEQNGETSLPENSDQVVEKEEQDIPVTEK
jgi:hypothetical protein